MKQTVNLYEFREAFRAIRPDNFSYEGLDILFEYLEQLGEDIGEEIELDVIAICCDYSEDDFQVVAEQFELDVPTYDVDPLESLCEKIRERTGFAEYTSENTIVYYNVY